MFWIKSLKKIQIKNLKVFINKTSLKKWVKISLRYKKKKKLNKFYFFAFAK